MNKAAQEQHAQNIIRQISRVCFKPCLSKEHFSLDRECLQTCYDKYLFTLQTVNQSLKAEGMKHYSDFILTSWGVERDLVDEMYFPLEGLPMTPSGTLRKKVYAQYIFSRHNEKSR